MDSSSIRVPDGIQWIKWWLQRRCQECQDWIKKVLTLIMLLYLRYTKCSALHTYHCTWLNQFGTMATSKVVSGILKTTKSVILYEKAVLNFFWTVIIATQRVLDSSNVRVPSGTHCRQWQPQKRHLKNTKHPRIVNWIFLTPSLRVSMTPMGFTVYSDMCED